MEPLKPEVRAQILRDRPDAQPADIDEYERLLAARFTQDPSRPRPAPTRFSRRATTDQEREDRLRELYRKLFG